MNLDFAVRVELTRLELKLYIYIFSHLKLCLATAIHKLKWLKICVIFKI